VLHLYHVIIVLVSCSSSCSSRRRSCFSCKWRCILV